MLCGTAVALGAIGSHALRDKISAHYLNDVWETAARYQFFHGLALLFLSLHHKPVPASVLKLLLSGVLVFCLTLYPLALNELLAMPGLKKLGMITPAGGVLMISGWTVLAVHLFRWRKQAAG